MGIGTQTVSAVILVGSLSLIIFAFPRVGGGQSREERGTAPDSQPDSADEGAALLAAEKWDQAREFFGLRSYLVEKAVLEAWESHDGRPRAERDRFHYHLTNFLVNHGDLPRVLLQEDSLDMEEIGAAYSGWAKRLPEEDRDGELDFSHLDLIPRFRTRDWKQPLTEGDLETVLAALKENPRSIPALMVYRRCVYDIRDPGAKEGLLKAGREIVTWPVGRLAILRWLVGTRYAPIGETAHTIVSEDWKLAPSDKEKAQLLYVGAMFLENDWGQEGDRRPERVRKAYSRVYEEFPSSSTADEARWRSIVGELRDVGPEAAIEELRRIRGLGPQHGGGLDKALYMIAQVLMLKKNHDAAEPLLLEIARDYPEGEWVGKGGEYLAEISAARGDTEGEWKWIRRNVELDRPAASAVKRMAQWHEEKGEWEKAEEQWRRWRPESFCGNCGAALALERVRNRGRCLERLGRFKDAVGLHTDALLIGGYSFLSSTADVSADLFLLYKNAGQLGDLAKVMEAIEKERHKSMGGGTPTEAARLRFLRQLLMDQESAAEGVVEALVDVCRRRNRPHRQPLEEGGPDGRCRAAAEALAAHGDEAVRALRGAFAAAYQGSKSSCLLYALGRNPSPQALAALEWIAGGEARGAESEDVFYAIAMRGEAGEKLLERLAGDDVYVNRNHARRWLEKVRAGEGPGSGDTRPRPKPGSLPREIEIP